MRILERQIPLAQEPARAVELALLRAQILDERLHNTEEAARALEQVIAELNPRSWEAHERLRALYERRRTGRGSSRSPSGSCSSPRIRPSARRARWSWACCGATAWATQKKAIAAFERVLEIDADNLEALRALAPL